MTEVFILTNTDGQKWMAFKYNEDAQITRRVLGDLMKSTFLISTSQYHGNESGETVINIDNTMLPYFEMDLDKKDVEDEFSFLIQKFRKEGEMKTPN